MRKVGLLHGRLDLQSTALFARQLPCLRHAVAGADSWRGWQEPTAAQSAAHRGCVLLLARHKCLPGAEVWDCMLAHAALPLLQARWAGRLANAQPAGGTQQCLQAVPTCSLQHRSVPGHVFDAKSTCRCAQLPKSAVRPCSCLLPDAAQIRTGEQVNASAGLLFASMPACVAPRRAQIPAGAALMLLNPTSSE